MMKLIRGWKAEVKGFKILYGHDVTKKHRRKYIALMVAHHVVGILNAIVSLPFALFALALFFAIHALKLGATITMIVLDFVKKVTLIHYILPMIEKARTDHAAELVIEINKLKS